MGDVCGGICQVVQQSSCAAAGAAPRARSASKAGDGGCERGCGGGASASRRLPPWGQANKAQSGGRAGGQPSGRTEDDVALVLGVLQPVVLDVGPQPLDDLAAGGRGVERLRESGCTPTAAGRPGGDGQAGSGGAAQPAALPPKQPDSRAPARCATPGTDAPARAAGARPPARSQPAQPPTRPPAHLRARQALLPQELLHLRRQEGAQAGPRPAPALAPAARPARRPRAAPAAGLGGTQRRGRRRQRCWGAGGGGACAAVGQPSGAGQPVGSAANPAHVSSSSSSSTSSSSSSSSSSPPSCSSEARAA